MTRLYVFGGEEGQYLNSCLKYDTRTGKCGFIGNMSSVRTIHKCTVFEGKIVVTGGCCYGTLHLKSVEAYDHHENKWTYLPDMIEKRYYHGTVSMGNKMFVIGGFKHLTWNLTCEVFESTSRKFTSINQLLAVNKLYYYQTSVVSIGYKVLFFYSTRDTTKNKLQVYDVPRDQWCLKQNDFIEARWYTSCSKLQLV